jgi:hypothetical protein
MRPSLVGWRPSLGGLAPEPRGMALEPGAWRSIRQGFNEAAKKVVFS